MNEKRITIRLTEEEHTKLKLLCVKMKLPMNKVLLNYVQELITKENNNEEK